VAGADDIAGFLLIFPANAVFAGGVGTVSLAPVD